MSRLPVLSGSSVFLTRITREDALELGRYFSNLEFTTYLGGYGFTNGPEDQQAWAEGILKNDSSRVYFGVCESGSDRLVGGVELRNINARTGTATLGVAVYDPQDWGRGFGSEAVRLMVAYGMFHLNLFNIDLYVFAFNERAVRSYLGAGFRTIGRRTGSQVLGGERFDEIWMEITRPELNPADLGRLRAQIRLLGPVQD
ncbi:RimJ/RimL family protein N-acetyltransferase [Deinobacterium chartae]|uniref:RimJ/RimL family protein N-acetyltransferase n=1 Tax=Deinobacterium chartae TaxID=521158 RepID=A0A841I5E2_9DEIO|nr:GNAT family protein [Deinobacterium chartae]MBB6099095.1 RimJ/RimL family protein N-acetyltransferase [Deinobacterium chartae]